MITMRVGAVILLAAFATAQNTSPSKTAKSNIAEPELPVIDYSGGGAIVGSVQVVTKRSTIYDTWRANRKAIGQLSEDETVHEFGSVCITRKPDRFLVRKANPDFTLKSGDVILQYQHWGVGKADIWANGGWHRDFDWGEVDENGKLFYTEKEGTLWPVLKKWDLTLLEPGIREWWARVGREDGTAGWVLVQGNLRFEHMNLLFSASPDEKVGSKMPLAAADIAAPRLPVIDYSTCPGDGRIVPDWKIERDDRMYSSFQDDRTVVGTLKAGEKVTVLRGANLVREPDRAVIKYIGPYDDSSLLKVGQLALGYGVEPNQDVVFWSNGLWFAEWIEAVAEKGHCGFRLGFDAGGCSIDIVKDGISEWWLQVRTSSGLTGWALAEKINGDKRRDGNFSALCHYGED
jgi:hypothetical protein